MDKDVVLAAKLYNQAVRAMGGNIDAKLKFRLTIANTIASKHADIAIASIDNVIVHEECAGLIGKVFASTRPHKVPADKVGTHAHMKTLLSIARKETSRLTGVAESTKRFQTTNEHYLLVESITNFTIKNACDLDEICLLEFKHGKALMEQAAAAEASLSEQDMVPTWLYGPIGRLSAAKILKDYVGAVADAEFGNAFLIYEHVDESTKCEDGYCMATLGSNTGRVKIGSLTMNPYTGLWTNLGKDYANVPPFSTLVQLIESLENLTDPVAAPYGWHAKEPTRSLKITRPDNHVIHVAAPKVTVPPSTIGVTTPATAVSVATVGSTAAIPTDGVNPNAKKHWLKVRNFVKEQAIKCVNDDAQGDGFDLDSLPTLAELAILKAEANAISSSEDTVGLFNHEVEQGYLGRMISNANFTLQGVTSVMLMLASCFNRASSPADLGINKTSVPGFHYDPFTVADNLSEKEGKTLLHEGPVKSFDRSWTKVIEDYMKSPDHPLLPKSRYIMDILRFTFEFVSPKACASFYVFLLLHPGIKTLRSKNKL